MKTKHKILSRRAAVGCVVFSTLLGMWMLGWNVSFWSRQITQEDIEQHVLDAAGGIPDTDDIQQGNKVAGSSNVYTPRSILKGGLLGCLLGLLSIPAINWYLGRKPKSQQKEDESQPMREAPTQGD